MKLSFSWMYYKDKVQELAGESILVGLFAAMLVNDLADSKWFMACVDTALLVWGYRCMKSSAKDLRGEQHGTATN